MNWRFYTYPPIVLPEPEILGKYGKLAASAMRNLREKVKAKGQEHGDFVKHWQQGWTYQEWEQSRKKK